MSRDRRDSPREPLECKATVVSGSESFECRLVDISSSGIGLRSDVRHTPSPFVSVRFTPPRQSDPVSHGGILIRRRQAGSGFEWGVSLLSETVPQTGVVIETERWRDEPSETVQTRLWSEELDAWREAPRDVERDPSPGPTPETTMTLSFSIIDLPSMLLMTPVAEPDQLVGCEHDRVWTIHEQLLIGC